MKKYYSLETNQQTRTADLYIFGDIVDASETGMLEAFDVDMGETSSLSIVKDIQGLDVDTINVHINSMGGYVNEGLAIYNVLKNHSATVNTYVDGFACSAASVVFMAGDNRIMSSASLLMIHKAWVDMQGNGAQLRQEADVLDKISQAAANAYLERINIGAEELNALLDGEDHAGSWILPDDALKMGFATKVLTGQKSGAAQQSAMASVIKMLAKRPPKSKSDKAVTVALQLDTTQFYAELDKAKASAKQAMEELNGRVSTNADRLKNLFGGK